MPRAARAVAVPSLEERKKPGLSVTLAGPKHPARCQSCARWGDDPNCEAHAIDKVVRNAPIGLLRWVECDANDKPTTVVVVLCVQCSERLIEPHHRQYRQVSPSEPRPGTMLVCLNCRLRNGVMCTSPAAKANGGPGIHFTYEKPPIRAMVDGTDYRGPMVIWTRVLACPQAEPRTPNQRGT